MLAKNKLSTILYLSIIIFPLLFIWQGLDFSDTGFWLTNFQQIFNDPVSITHSFFICWLTNIIGGTWVYFFGNFGLIGIRFAEVLILYITMYLVFLILRPYIKKDILLTGIFIALIFISRFYWPNYDTLTSLFYLLISLPLIKGLTEHKIYFLYISGFICGLNVFIRFPNILGLVLVFIIIYYGYLNKDVAKNILKNVLYYMLGFICATVIVLVIMKIIGQYDIFIISLQDLFNISHQSSSSHSIYSLLYSLIVDHLKVIFITSGFLVMMLALSAILLRKKDRYYLLTYIPISIFLFILIIFSYKDYLFILYSFLIYFVVGILYIVLIIQLFNSDKQNEYRTLILLALLILIISPLGSNNGLGNAPYGMWLAIPISIYYLSLIKSIKFSYLTSYAEHSKSHYIVFNEEWIKKIKKIFMFSFIIITLVIAYRYTYRDSPDRFTMVYPINQPMLKYIYTTKDRAIVVQELVNELKKYVNKNDYLLSTEPMIYYLTDTKPYLYNSWPLSYDVEDFNTSLERALKERSSLPVIVIAKESTESFDWPKIKTINNELIYDESRPVRNENLFSLESFIVKKQYKCIWSNSYFKIMVPSKK